MGVPYAVAAALAFPGRQVISINGDGAFGINAMEIDTAVRHGAKAVFIVSNNAAWNIERFDQESNYGGRVVGTVLRHSDYAAMARALGAHGERVEKLKTSPSAQAALDNALRLSTWSRRKPRSVGCQEGPRLRAGLPPLRPGRCRAQAPGFDVAVSGPGTFAESVRC